ncbi:hypothetical protein PV328_010352 [Microctonus aethiopoides]|uniref:Uncharacterized protein n=1 Tax=Microctonus aethiopoides TaxID=144406 RepID=A0AA39FHQ1_9HYME|nr:hypothetical protein PV328_010352 [Microctonus aethiopoides]
MGALPGSATPSRRTRGTRMEWPITTPSSQQRRSPRAAARVAEEAIHRLTPRAAAPRTRDQEHQGRTTPVTVKVKEAVVKLVRVQCPVKVSLVNTVKEVSVKLVRVKIPMAAERKEDNFDDNDEINEDHTSQAAGQGQDGAEQPTRHQDEAVWVNQCINLNESKGMQECVGASQRMNISCDSIPSPQSIDASNIVVIPYIKLAQTNLSRSKNATSDMYSLVQKQRLDVLLT